MPLPLIGRLPRLTASGSLQLFPYTLLLTAVLIYGLVAAQPAPRPSHPLAPELREWASYSAGAAALLAMGGRLLRAARLPARLEFSDIKVYSLSIQAGMLLLTVPAYLYLFKSPQEDLRWILDTVFDKRWKFALYWLGVGTFLFLPYLFRFLCGAAPEPVVRPAKKYKARNAAPAVPPVVPSHGEALSTPAAASPCFRASALRVALALAAAFVLSYFYAGPPWHLDRHHRDINSHEQVNLGPLQAMHKGYLAYVGPASTQYGPGVQAVLYRLMLAQGRFDLVGYRTACAAMFYASVFLLCFVAAMLLPPWAVVPAVWLALLYSPFTFFKWLPDGTLSGFYGWANGLRYMGILLTAAFLPAAVVAQQRARCWPWISARGLALGLVWGLFSWLAQENLTSTVAAATLILSIHWLSGTSSGRAALAIAAGMTAGFVLFWTPILGYYAAHGAAAEFLRCYFLAPSAVVQGFSNTDWSSGVTDPEYRAFCYTALVVVALGILTLVRWPSLRLSAPLCPKRMRMLSFVAALAAGYPASLFRSDTSHFRATLTALPFVLLLAVVDVPEWLAKGARARAAWRLAVAAMALWIYPLWRSPSALAGDLLTDPLARFAAPPSVPAPPDDRRIPFQRAGLLLADEPIAFDGAPPMREFLEEMSALREIVGDRATYVESLPATMIGLVYFLLDLKPAPYLLDKDLLIVNEVVEKEALAYYRRHVSETECMVSANDSSPEARIFKRAHPGFTRLRRTLGKRPYFVYLAPPAGSGGGIG